MAPTVIIENNEVNIFYSAWDVEDGQCIPVLPGERFGLPIPAGDRCTFAGIGRAVFFDLIK